VEDPRDDAACPPLQVRRSGPLRLKNRPELVIEGEHPAFTVLCRPGFEAYDADVEIDLPPLQRQDFGWQGNCSRQVLHLSHSSLYRLDLSQLAFSRLVALQPQESDR
jgi:hypothetical protein